MIPQTLLTASLWALAVLGSPIAPRFTGELLPKNTYTYDVGTGAISCTPNAKIFKHWTNNGHDITTLMTFEYTNAMAGRTCQFGFKLASGDISTGSQLFDLFQSLHPVKSCPTTAYPPNNGRDQHLGRMKAATPDATWVDQFLYLSRPVPCKPPGTVEAFELVGVYDAVDIEWSGTSGPRILY